MTSKFVTTNDKPADAPAHVHSQESAVGGTDLARETTPVGEQFAALLRVASLPVTANSRGAGAAAAGFARQKPLVSG